MQSMVRSAMGLASRVLLALCANLIKKVAVAGVDYARLATKFVANDVCIDALGTGSKASIFPTSPDATDLSAFKQHGGKMIPYHGTSDPVLSFNDTRNWYEGVNPDVSTNFTCS